MAILTHLDDVGPIAHQFHGNFHQGFSTLGGLGLLLLFLHAYSLGGGTYTGIEAVSNGLQIMREPRVHTGKRTMVYISTSLALTAGGIFVCYLLLKVRPVEGQTLNAVLAGNLFGRWTFGHWLALITILSEGALLFVAAQTGFIDGPRVMSNMAVDSWFPHRFASLVRTPDDAERHPPDGDCGPFAPYLHPRQLQLLSSCIPSMSLPLFPSPNLGMSRFFITHRKTDKKWKRHLPIIDWTDPMSDDPHHYDRLRSSPRVDGSLSS